MYSFVASNGRIAWSHTMGGWVYGSPAVWNGLVFEASYDGTFQAMDARTGAVRWSRNLGFATTSSPTMIGPYVYVASHGRTSAHGNLWAFNPHTGRQVWHFHDGWYSTVVAAGTDAIAAVGPQRLYYMRTRTH
jgi:outer membrane protein assembly factor BamB